jgi:hypothetical protein
MKLISIVKFYSSYAVRKLFFFVKKSRREMKEWVSGAQ